MKYYVFLLISLFIFPFTKTVWSQEKPINESSLLWEVNGNGLAKPSYIFGTIHILPRKQFLKYKIADDKLKESDLLVLEILLDVPLSTQIQWGQKMVLEDGKTVEDYMGKKQIEDFRTIMIDSLEWSEKKYGRYIRMKPFVIYSIVLKESIGKISGYELYFSKLAKKKKIQSMGLETFEFQAGLFDSFSFGKQMKMFFGDDFSLDFQPMLDKYFEQNIDSLYAYSVSSPEIKGMQEIVLDNRNINWAEQFVSLSKNKSLFIAVGAAHLGGQKGIIALLRKKGYSVQPIKID